MSGVKPINISDTYAHMSGRTTVWFIFLDNYVPRAAADTRSGRGKSSKVLCGTGVGLSGKTEDFRIISDRPETDQENEELSKICHYRSSRTSIKLVNL